MSDVTIMSKRYAKVANALNALDAAEKSAFAALDCHGPRNECDIRALMASIDAASNAAHDVAAAFDAVDDVEHYGKFIARMWHWKDLYDVLAWDKGDAVFHKREGWDAFMHFPWYC